MENDKENKSGSTKGRSPRRRRPTTSRKQSDTQASTRPSRPASPASSGGRSRPARPARKKSTPASSASSSPARLARRPRSLKSAVRKKRAYQIVINELAEGYSVDTQIKLAQKLKRRIASSGFEAEITQTDSWDAFGSAVSTAIRTRPFALIIMGGDGSVRLAGSRVARGKGLLGIIPTGKYNNIYQSLYGNTDCDLALDLIRSEYQTRIDAASANGRFFLGNLITGLVPNMLNRLGDKMPPRLAMSWTKLSSGSIPEVKPKKMKLKMDGFTLEAQPQLFNIHLLPSLMGLRFAPVSIPDDGRLVVIYDREDVGKNISHYIRDLKKNKYQYSDGMQMIRGMTLTIGPAVGRDWLIDGDPIRFAGDKIVVEVHHRALRVFSHAPEKK